MKRAAILYILLTILLAYPLSLHPADRVMADAPDTHLYMWTLAWDTHALVHQPFHIFDANIFHPELRTLAYSENLIGSAFVAAPVLWATGNPVLAMNIVVLFAAAACGLGGFVLARRIGVSHSGATLAGLIFAFAPPRFLRLDQVHLATIEWMPFALAFLHGYLEEGRARDLKLAAAFFTLQALTSGHGAVFLAIACGGLIAFRFVAGGLPPMGRWARDLGIPGALLIVPVAMAAVPYLIVQHELGLKRSLSDNWAVPLSSFLASPTRLHAYLLSLVPQARINETAGAYLFPGYLPMILAVLAFVWPPREIQTELFARRGLRFFYGGLFLLCVGLSLGPPLSLWPLVYWLPGMNFVRAPSRFMLLGLMALAVVAGIGFDRLATWLPGRKRGWVAGLLGIGLVAEFAAIPLGLDPYRLELPASDRWLAAQPGPHVVAELPQPDPTIMGRSERRQTAYMLYSTASWWKTVHGYSGFMTPSHFDLYKEMAGFPSEASLESLAAFGVTHVVVHTDDYSPSDLAAVEQRLAQFGDDWLTLLHTEPDGRVYALRRQMSR